MIETMRQMIALYRLLRRTARCQTLALALAGSRQERQGICWVRVITSKYVTNNFIGGYLYE